MMDYLGCMKLAKGENGKCRLQSKAYLECRMQNGLMERDDWEKYVCLTSLLDQCRSAVERIRRRDNDNRKLVLMLHKLPLTAQ